jgi:hypothetical protein
MVLYESKMMEREKCISTRVVVILPPHGDLTFRRLIVIVAGWEVSPTNSFSLI